MKPWNSVKDVAYGIPHGRGANLLMYRTDKVKPAPDSWSVVFDKASPYKGTVTAYDSPIYIADAALYLKATKPELGLFKKAGVTPRCEVREFRVAPGRLNEFPVGSDLQRARCVSPMRPWARRCLYASSRPGPLTLPR